MLKFNCFPGLPGPLRVWKNSRLSGCNQFYIRKRTSVSVLVIGGAGYIGSHAARVLRRRGHEVIIYDNLSTGYASLAEGFELVRGDILDPDALARVLRRVDAVMHFAAHAYVGE